ncbi:hypothetical protein FE257_011438 [Aspergillus nanangensis]|uniref:Hemagglutinin protein n=1 Tax=Aspergillus nanangensis TaxID=2582783 RepID=A0AAD4GRD1_ASPNN|nr:hypothetical protein FE257_011438 [Aspergillus nanangensis]
MSSSQRMGMYTVPPVTPKVAGVLPTNSPGLHPASFPRQSYDMGPTDSQPSYSRSPLVDHAISYEDESAYASPPSAYMIPNTPQGLDDYCALPWTKAAWNPNLNMSRGSSISGALFPDHEAEGTVHQPTYTTYMFSGQGTPSTDPSMTLPETQGTDRTLPTPTTRSQQMGLSGLATMPEAISGLTPPQDFRIAQTWPTKAGGSNNVRGMQPAFSSGPMSRTKWLPPSTHDLMFGLMPMPSTGTTSPLMHACGGFTGLESVEGSGGDDFRDSQTRITRPFSRDSTNGRLTRINEYSSDIYGYSSSEKKKCSNTGDAGVAATLINGLPYTRPKPLEQPFPTPVIGGFQELPITVTREHQTPASALSNAGGF